MGNPLFGSTLSLSYSITHPSKCEALILRGIFLLRKKEIDWFYQKGCSFIYPDAWEGYLSPIPEEERDNLVAAYYKRLTSSDDAVRIEAAKAWSIWEASTSKLFQSKNFLIKSKYSYLGNPSAPLITAPSFNAD